MVKKPNIPLTKPVASTTLKPTNNEKRGVEIFKAGEHKPMEGISRNFPISMLHEVAASYDQKKHNAPVVIGHPKTDAPAYGWISGLSVQGDKLLADFDQVDGAFAEIVTAGRYKNISAAFFSPEAADNPVPGKFSLKHVGFLGATAPAVKGLKPVEFSGSNDGVIEFGEDDYVFANSIAAEAIKRYENQIAMEKLVDAGKLLPCHSTDMLCFVESLENTGTICFANGQEMGPRDWFLQYLNQLPAVITFGAYPMGDEKNTIGAMENIPDGYHADEAGKQLHGRAKALAKSENITFQQAVIQLERNQN